jgi:hypothetical protein
METFRLPRFLRRQPHLVRNDTAMKNLARYIIRASFPKKRTRYLDQEGKVVYTSKDGKTSKSFPSLEWLANLFSQIPNQGEQIMRYYGHYSNVSRGKRQQDGSKKAVPCILEPEGCKDLPAKLGEFDTEDLRSRSPGLLKVQGHHAGHQQHRRPVGDPGPSQSPGHLARQVHAAA